jgi:superfamily II DNA or RNA helicase
MHSTKATRKNGRPRGDDSEDKFGKLPRSFDWRSTDQEEIALRRRRARDEQPQIINVDSKNPIFSRFDIRSKSGMVYSVEIRSVASRLHSCTCVDFRTSGLGTCKHLEAVLLHLEARFPELFAKAQEVESERIDVVWNDTFQTLQIESGRTRLPRRLAAYFDASGMLLDGNDPETVIQDLRDAAISSLRISQDVQPSLDQIKRRTERIALRRSFEEKVQAGIYPAQETLVPLFPYQREGMVHLAFSERALIADEMGLGKTIQAIAACALLNRLGKAGRVLVVTPASLKTEWEEQIQRFTTLPYQVVFGPRHERLRIFQSSTFFTIVNYEQIVRDALDINRLLRPDVVILDEAQRIKNWNTKTAQAVKRLESRYAFVLTGTPIENRIDELYSIVDYLDSNIFGPLFRFNREFYELDENGKPSGYRNLGRLHERIRHLLIRRRKIDVETELPGRIDQNFFVPLSSSQFLSYAGHEQEVAQLARIAKRRPLTKQQQEKLMRELAMMRMICDTNYILDPNDRTSPKIQELQRILEECLSDGEVKVIIFSEWERMLELVRELLRQMKIRYGWHTGSVPQKRRRAEIQMFKSDPTCRVFLSTDSGGVGLNLQAASVVINCDLPWNPAKLEQRIARAWRKNQTRTVTVVNLVAEKTIEHRMLETLATKKGLADGVLDQIGDLAQIQLKSGGQKFLSKLEQIMAPVAPSATKHPAPPLPVDRSAAFAERMSKIIAGHLVACEERFPDNESHSVLIVVVERDAASWIERLRPIHEQLFAGRQSDSLAPVQLEVLDRATADALDRLAEAGLIHKTIRATRHLYPDLTSTAAPLTDEESAQATAYRERAARKLKMARVLAAEELHEESRIALREAVLYQARAFATKARLPEPEKPEDAILPPFSAEWRGQLPVIRKFLEDEGEVDAVIQGFTSLNHS